jgi:ABC-type transport system involved in cytochrome bd biosynthesis fused ATPase/permease subunit
LYKIADIYLLDDPLSAVDSHVGKIVFEQCFKQYLKGKTVILTTHQLQHVPQADQVCLINAGAVVAHGSYEHVHTTSPDFFHHVLQESAIYESDQNMQIP